jgi:hypothetical protein
MTNRTMYDSTTIQDVPADAEMVAYYPHAFPPSEETLKRFNPEKTVLLRIDNRGSNPKDCGILDVESGAATVADAPVWAKERHAAGFKVTLYCNRDTLPALEKVMAAVVPDIPWFLWIADPTGTPHTWEHERVVATQWGWPGKGYPNDQEHHYDTSLVTNDEWHAQPAPKAEPKAEVQPIGAEAIQATSAPLDVSVSDGTSTTAIAGTVVFVSNGQLAMRGMISNDQGQTWENA